MTPFYQRLPEVVGFNIGRWVDPVGLSLTGLAAAAVVVHGVSEVVRRRVGNNAPSSGKAPSSGDGRSEVE